MELFSDCDFVKVKQRCWKSEVKYWTKENKHEVNRTVNDHYFIFSNLHLKVKKKRRKTSSPFFNSTTETPTIRDVTFCSSGLHSGYVPFFFFTTLRRSSVFCECPTISLLAVTLKTACVFLWWWSQISTFPEGHDQRVSELAAFELKWMWWLVLSILSAVLCNIHFIQSEKGVTQTRRLLLRQNPWRKV